MHNFAAFSLVTAWRAGFVGFCDAARVRIFVRSCALLHFTAKCSIHCITSRLISNSWLQVAFLSSSVPCMPPPAILSSLMSRCRAQLTSWDFVDRCSFARDISSHSPVSTGPLCLCKVRARWNILGANSSNSYTKSINMGGSMRVTV